MSLLEVRYLAVQFRSAENTIDAVKDVSLRVEAGESVALVGESGSGKSVTALSVLQLLGAQAHIERGSVRFDGQEIIRASKRTLRGIRGNRISMIF